jgi:hypothetical protein
VSISTPVSGLGALRPQRGSIKHGIELSGLQWLEANSPTVIWENMNNISVFAKTTVTVTNSWKISKSHNPRTTIARQIKITAQLVKQRETVHDLFQ